MTVKISSTGTPWVTVTKDRTKEILEAVKALTSKEVLVGVPEASAERDPEPGETEKPPSNSEIGYWQEFGVPEKNIPARPFLIPGVESALERIIPRLKRAGVQALEGDVSKVDAQFTAVGLMAVSAVQQKIVDGPFVPLAPLTLAKRKARGRTGEKPLLDTGALRQAQTFVVAKKER